MDGGDRIQARFLAGVMNKSNNADVLFDIKTVYSCLQ